MFEKTFAIAVNHSALLPVVRQFNRVLSRLQLSKGFVTEREKATLLLKIDVTVDVAKIENLSDLFIVTAKNTEEIFHTLMYMLLLELSNHPIEQVIQPSLLQSRRIVLLDIGRKYYSKDEIFTLIDLMSLAQFNVLQLHFSENTGFRIESEVAPEIVSEEYLTKTEIQEILIYAKNAAVEVVPDFDSPGHLKQVLANYPKWQLEKLNERGQLIKDETALDLTNPEAVDFIFSLYEEYANLFTTSRYFHIGADEFVDFDAINQYPKLVSYAKKQYGDNAQAIDAFVGYVNCLVEKIRMLGFIPQVWNDGFFRTNRQEVVKLTKDVEVTYWTKWNQQMAPLEVFIQKGYTLLNYNDNYLYYVLGEQAGYSYPTYSKIMTKWQPTMWAQKQATMLDAAKFPGVAVSIWTDDWQAQTVTETFQQVGEVLFAVMQKERCHEFMTQDTIRQLIRKIS